MTVRIIDENGSEWGVGNTEEEAYENAKENYLSKYPEEEGNEDIVDSFDAVQEELRILKALLQENYTCNRGDFGVIKRGSFACGALESQLEKTWIIDDLLKIETENVATIKSGEFRTFKCRHFSHDIKGPSEYIVCEYNNEDLKKSSDPYEGDMHEFLLTVKRSGNNLYYII